MIHKFSKSIFPAMALGMALFCSACVLHSGEPAEVEAAVVESASSADPMDATEAPDVFRVLLECSNGNILIECHKDWAPIGAQHFYELVNAGYYDGARFFRVIPGFMTQFGLAADPAMTAALGQEDILDDPVTQSNTPGMVTYAKTGAPNSRSTQLFINTGNNARLDSDGFTPFAVVLEGLDVVEAINAEYGERPNQGQITSQGNEYLNANFPNLDFIKKASIVR